MVLRLLSKETDYDGTWDVRHLVPYSLLDYHMSQTGEWDSQLQWDNPSNV